MSDNKKYYYLKFKENFFDSEAMIILESMPDGYLYSNILIKLYLRSLKNDGKLIFNKTIPYNSTILAQVVRHNVGVVEKALDIFKQLGLVEILDNGAIYMLDIQNYIGQSSSEADRQRDYQQRIRREKLGLPEKKCKKSNKESNMIPTPEKEIEKELKLELKKDIKKTKQKKEIDFVDIETIDKPDFLSDPNWLQFKNWWHMRLKHHSKLKSTQLALNKQLNIIKNFDNTAIAQALKITISGDANAVCYQNIIIKNLHTTAHDTLKRCNSQDFSEPF